MSPRCGNFISVTELLGTLVLAMLTGIRNLYTATRLAGAGAAL